MLGSVLASAWRAGSLRLVSVNALFVAPAQAFTVPEVGKRQLNEINRIRYELELMAVALAVENLTMQKNVAMLKYARQIPGLKIITQIATQYLCRHHNFVRAQVRNIARLTH